jgi:nucleoside-diphosphate-sugar epimerase
MSVLVTGATGFIGLHVAALLVQEGERVRALCRATADTTPLRRLNVEIVEGDVVDAASVQRAADGCDRVFHLAAYARNWARDPRTFYDVNVGGLEHVLDAASRVSASATGWRFVSRWFRRACGTSVRLPRRLSPQSRAGLSSG